MKSWINKMETGLENAQKRSVKVKDMRILMLIIILGIIFHIGYAYFLVDGDSMESTYKEGDKLLVNKITYNFLTPDKGDVIVFYTPLEKEVLIKRIVALPYDTVEIIEGLVLVNDKPLSDEYSRALLMDHTIGKEYVNRKKIYLSYEEYYAIGDNRSGTWFGVVQKEEIIGYVPE
jgi:signal peptidase I